MKQTTTVQADGEREKAPQKANKVKVSTNGSSPEVEPFPLAPPRTVRSRVPQALLAALLIVGGGLGGLVLFSRYNQRVPVVVVGNAVQHGEILDREDLVIAEVAVTDDVATVSAISEAAGRFAAHDLEPGDLISPNDLAEDDQLLTGDESVIGLLLEPGQYPTRKLAPGDRVDVFSPGATEDAGNAGDAGGSAAPGGSQSGEALAADLIIFDVVESSSDGRTLLVSLVVTPAQAAAVFEASDANGVRLALRGKQ